MLEELQVLIRMAVLKSFLWILHLLMMESICIRIYE